MINIDEILKTKTFLKKAVVISQQLYMAPEIDFKNNFPGPEIGVSGLPVAGWSKGYIYALSFKTKQNVEKLVDVVKDIVEFRKELETIGVIFHEEFVLKRNAKFVFWIRTNEVATTTLKTEFVEIVSSLGEYEIKETTYPSFFWVEMFKKDSALSYEEREKIAEEFKAKIFKAFEKFENVLFVLDLYNRQSLKVQWILKEQVFSRSETK